MRHLLLFILLGALLGTVWALPIESPELREFLRIAPTAAEYPGDDAVWVLRDVMITVDPSGGTTTRERKVARVLTNAGLALANWEIPYDRSREEVEVRTARTLVGDTALLVDRTLSQDNAVYPTAAWYDALTIRRFPMPAPTVGAFFEVETIIRRPEARIPGAFDARLHLRDRYPIHQGRFTVRVPADWQLTLDFTGMTASPVRETIEGDHRVYRWEISKVPALRITETQTPAINDLLAGVHITSLRSWSAVAHWYQGITAGADSPTDDVRSAASMATAGCRTTDERIACLFARVRALPYIALEMGNLSDTPHTAAEVLWQGYGDCKDKAVLLRAVLAAVGISSDYVLVRTSDRGVLNPHHYGPGAFNHVILVAYTEQGERYLDPTVATADAGQLAPGVEGASALIVRGSGELTTLPFATAANNQTDVRMIVTVAADGSATGHAEMTLTGQAALIQRDLLNTVPDGRFREALEAGLAPRFGADITITDVRVAHLADPARPLILAIDFASAAYVQPAGAMLCGSLPIVAYQPNAYRAVKTRAYPFVIYSEGSLSVDAQIRLPDGLSVVSLPSPVSVESPFGTYTDTTEAPDATTVRYRCTLATRRGIFPPDALPIMRTWAATLALEGRNQMQFYLKRR